MTKRQLEAFERKAEAIWQKGLHRVHAMALESIRQLEHLRGDYLAAAFKSTKPPRAPKDSVKG